MSKTNLFVKNFKNILNLINRLLENNLNKLNFKNLKYLSKNNKIVLTFVTFFVIFISYLLLPTLFNKNEVSKMLNEEIKRKFDVDFIFSKNPKYAFFPKPHFITSEVAIVVDENKIAKINKLKIFISLNNFFSLKNIKVKDLILENANFTLDKKNYNFFISFLKKNFKDKNLIFKNSNIFFKNFDNEVLFINKILKMKYYYDENELRNVLFAENEIFNTPYSIVMYFNSNKSKIFSNINFNLINLKIENELDFQNKIKVGKSKFKFNKLKIFSEYEIKKNFFEFLIFDEQDKPSLKYKGEFNFKPFYGNLKGDLKNIKSNYLLESNSTIVRFLKTKLLNNKNIDFNLKINAGKILNNPNFKNININSKIKDGLIDVNETKFEWNDFANFQLSESLIFIKKGELVLDGKLNIKIKDYNKIYKFLLTPKNNRKEIKEINLNFTYNFDRSIAKLKNIRVDNKINERVNIILSNIIFKKTILQNKIYFKNLLNDAIKNYSG